MRAKEPNGKKLNQLTKEDRAVIAGYLQRLKDIGMAPGIKTREDEWIVDHPDPLIGELALMDAVGTGDPAFFHGLMSQLAQASSRDGKLSKGELDFVLSVVKGGKPKDQVEAMLLAGMAVVHSTAMHFAKSLRNAQSTPELDSLERASNKLFRTFVAQSEALNRHRNSNEQNVTVNNVSVNEGGQAIVANVNPTRQKNSEKRAANSSRAPGYEPHPTPAGEAERVSAPTDHDPVVLTPRPSVQ